MQKCCFSITVDVAIIHEYIYLHTSHVAHLLLECTHAVLEEFRTNRKCCCHHGQLNPHTIAWHNRECNLEILKVAFRDVRLHACLEGVRSPL